MVKRFLVVIFICCLLSGCSFKKEKVDYPTAVDGVLDFSSLKWRGDIVPLNGEWSFEWYDSHTSDKNPTTTIEVPGTWGESGTPALKNQGYGIYKLTLLYLPQTRIMAIRVPNISTTYSLSINGVRLAKIGQPGKDAAATVPFQKPEIVYFQAKDVQTTIELEVANFHHRSGGIRTSLMLAEVSDIQKLQSRREQQELIVIGSLAMIGIYHFGLYVLRRKEGANLFFALLCLFVALRTGLIGEGFALRWMPFIDWQIATRLEYIVFVAAVWSGFAYYSRMYPNEIRKSWRRASDWLAAALVMTATALPSLWFTSILIGYQIYVLVFGIVVLFALIASTTRKREGAWLALAGVAGLLVTIINDILFYNGWGSSPNLVPYGLLFLIILNAFIISMRSSRTFVRAEQLSVELKEWNDRLEWRIAERTEELRRSYMTLEEAKIGLERMEHSRRQLISNISHDLRTPITLLQGYLEALRDGVIEEPERKDATIRLMLGKVEGLGRLIHDLFELSVLEARRVELAFETMTLDQWRTRMLAQYSLDMQEKEISFHCLLSDPQAAHACVSVDFYRMDRVFANLVYNAVRFTPKGGTVTVEFSLADNRRHADISVTDSGPGIHPDDLPHIFDRFYKKDKSRHSSSGGSGLGLSIAKEIVELHGGLISVSNLPEGGCRFMIELPISTVNGS